MYLHIYIRNQPNPRFVIENPEAIPRVGDTMIFDDVDGDTTSSTARKVLDVIWHVRKDPDGQDIKSVSVFLTA